MNETPAIWIRSAGELETFAASLRDAPRFAFDTESDNFHHYDFKVCVIQLAAPDGRIALLDTVAFRNVSVLGPLLSDPRIVKVVHAAAYDVALLKRDFGFTFAGLRDTEVDARVCGIPKTGLSTLLEEELGIPHSKALQQFDWSRRPLEPAHERYLTTDVRHLLALADRLEARLRARGRELWAAEEGAAMADVPPADPRETLDFMRAKGARELSTRELCVLRELFALRERWARRWNRPPFMVIGDAALLHLARRRPTNEQELAATPGLPKRFRSGRGHDLLAAIRRGWASREKLPERPSRPRLRRPRGWSGRVGRLKAWRGEAAERIGLDPGFLLPQRLIEEIAAAGPADREALARVPGVRNWRVRELGDGILEALQTVAKKPGNDYPDTGKTTETHP